MTITKSENEEGTVTNREDIRVWVTFLSGEKKKRQFKKILDMKIILQNQVAIPL